ncbi:TVP38/TMEM64 family protein [Celerinatantimonas yamalensis]|uniref:TVP38/TMEM64 family membrane protein n=1 Tax=Celerinatantimonas yamalensis TaxID=559956 RepID=A0ABW9GA39_9GAMM
MNHVVKQGIKITLLLLILVVVLNEIDNPMWQHVADHRWVASYIHQGGAGALISVLIFGMIFTGIGGPRQLLAAMLGYVFGATVGVITSLFCSLMGASCAYGVARFGLQLVLHRRFGNKLNKFHRFVSHQPFLKILLLRLLPVGSNVVTNLLSGCVALRYLPFLMGSLIGYLPQTIIFALAGSGFGKANRYQLAISISLGIISLIVGGLLYRSHLQRNVETVIKD